MLTSLAGTYGMSFLILWRLSLKLCAKDTLRDANVQCRHRINECLSLECRFSILRSRTPNPWESVRDLTVRKYLDVRGVPLIDIFIVPLTMAFEISVFLKYTCVVFFYFSLNDSYEDRKADFLFKRGDFITISKFFLVNFSLVLVMVIGKV